jgi:hypothetical protein
MKTNLGEKLGLHNERSIGGEVALAEDLEVAVGSDIDDRHLLLGEGLRIDENR